MTPLRGARASEPPWDWAVLRALCLRHARQVLGASALAEDAAQEAALRAWRNRRACRTPEAPDAWVAAIARHEAIRALPDRRQVPTEAIEEIAGAAPDEPLLDRLELTSAVAGLEPRDRHLLVGRYWLDRSYSELAEELGMPTSTVGVHLHRLRLRLRETVVRT